MVFISSPNSANRSGSTPSQDRTAHTTVILGSLPDTIEDDWIEDIEKVEAELKSFTKPESPADVFSLRYGDFLSVDGEDQGWEAWTKVVARRDIEERLMRPWNGRGSST